MAVGTATFVGFNGSKFLNEETITKLQGADEASLLRMPKKDLEQNTEKQKGLTKLTTIMTKLQTSFKDLADETSFLKRTVDTSGESATMSVSSGVSLQSLKIDVTQLADRDSYKSVNFKSRNDILGLNKDTTMRIKIDGIEYDLKLKKDATLQDLADAINDKTGGDVQAKIINVGGKNPYQMVIQSAKTGADKAIEFSEVGESNLFEAIFGVNSKTQVMQEDKDATAAARTSDPNAAPVMKPVTANGENIFKFDLSSVRLTEAADAKFEYNGLSVSRSSNSISDLRVGITIDLKKIGETSFEVKQDTKDMKKNLSDMVSAYNELMNELSTVTVHDSETNTTGVFQSTSEVKGIRDKLNKILGYTMQRDKDIDEINLTATNNRMTVAEVRKDNALMKKTISMADFGLSLNEKGLLEFDESTFNKKLSYDEAHGLQDVKNFFVSETKHNRISYQSGEINSGEIELDDKKNITINGVAIKFKTEATSTQEDNAKAFIKAVNDADISGLSVSYINGKITLSKADGYDIDISGDADKLAMFGLKKTTVQPNNDVKNGMFTQLKDAMLDLLAKDERGRDDGVLTKYAKSLKNNNEKLQKDIKKIQEDVKTKYDQMREQFIRYEQAIQKVQSMWAPMESMINFELAKK
ncbi:flagellar filament capping protein FliD [Campylobacter sp. 19-13652]|uniref:flagellar filament capping protein FliD n=1 Tax=Campylobacter sp. 19-13652 TaxID=2840180 RepID=UPI001C794675|nr:flagellar filament capping protein FliD [Campylobacter sp. 19-13652]BCX79834.1 flagellar hook-associated protein 2 [Campylobacter sp. 19-13652]